MKVNNYYGFLYTLPEDDERIPRLQKQLEERGFDDTETWSLFTTISRFILPRLKCYYELADNTIDLDHHPGYRQGLEKAIKAFELLSQDEIVYSPQDEATILIGLSEFARFYQLMWW